MNEHIDGAIKEHRDKIAKLLFEFTRNLDQTPDAVLHEHMRARLYWLFDELLEEERLLAHLAGETVEPKAHQLEARLVGRFGGRFG